MGWLDGLMATTTGIAVFVMVIVGVSTALSGVFSNALAISAPVAIGVGMAAMTGTYIGLAAEPNTREYRAAFASGAFGVTSLGVGVVAVGAGLPLLAVFAAGAGAGLFAALGVVVAFR